MKKLLLVTTLLLSGCAATEQAYFKVGAGYKLDETTQYYTRNGQTHKGNDPISARFEVGTECVWKNVTCGVAHHSQWGTGWPVDDKGEYQKTEVFIDVKFELKDLF